MILVIFSIIPTKKGKVSCLRLAKSAELTAELKGQAMVSRV